MLSTKTFECFPVDRCFYGFHLVMTTHVVFVSLKLRLQFWVDLKRICVWNYCLPLGGVKLIADWFKLCIKLNSGVWLGSFYLWFYLSGIKGKRIAI